MSDCSVILGLGYEHASESFLINPRSSLPFLFFPLSFFPPFFFSPFLFFFPFPFLSLSFFIDLFLTNTGRFKEEGWRSQHSTSVTFIQFVVTSAILFAPESFGSGRTSPVLGLVWMGWGEE